MSGSGFCPVHQQLDKQTFSQLRQPAGERFSREESEIFSAAANEVEHNIKPLHLLEGFRIWRRCMGCRRTGFFLDLPLILGCGDLLYQILSASTP